MALGRLMLAAGAAVAGLTAGWLTPGGLGALTAGAATVAIMNGYSKAFSP